MSIFITPDIQDTEHGVIYQLSFFQFSMSCSPSWTIITVLLKGKKSSKKEKNTKVS